MKVAICHAFQEPFSVETVPTPPIPPDGSVIQVKAPGLCRSDWHSWMGHNPGITLPHVPGHELAGEHTAPPIPMDRVIADELEILGSHGIQAHVFPEIRNLW